MQSVSLCSRLRFFSAAISVAGSISASASTETRFIVRFTRAERTPGTAAMAAVGEASWSNATHLLINEPKHPRFGQFLRGADIGLPMPEPVDEKTPAEDVYVVQLADGSLAAHTVAQPAELMVEREFTPIKAADATEDPKPIDVCTAFVNGRTDNGGGALHDVGKVGDVVKL